MYPTTPPTHLTQPLPAQTTLAGAQRRDAMSKRTIMVPNRNIIASLDGTVPKSPVSVVLLPWDDPDPEPPPPPPPPPRVFNGK